MQRYMERLAKQFVNGVTDNVTLMSILREFTEDPYSWRCLSVCAGWTLTWFYLYQTLVMMRYRKLCSD